MSKKCIKCGTLFLIKSKNHPFQRFCSRKCQIDYWIQAHPERMKEIWKLKRKRCHKQRMEYQRQYRLRLYPYKRINCCFCGAEFLQKPRSKQYCSVQCVSKAYYRRNRKKEFLAFKRWAKKNPDKLKKNAANKRARKLNAKGSFTEKEWLRLKERYDYNCAICKKRKKLTVDHIIPLSKGGTNYIKNIQPLCLNCNCKKYNNVQMSNK